MMRFKLNAAFVLLYGMTAGDMAYAAIGFCSEIFRFENLGSEPLEYFNRIEDVPYVAPGVFKKSTRIIEVEINNSARHKELTAKYPGRWTKAYVELADGRELHFFLHEDGHVAQVKWK